MKDRLNQYSESAHLYGFDQCDIVNDDITFYMGEAAATGRSIDLFELACGTGRVSIPLAAAGIMSGILI